MTQAISNEHRLLQSWQQNAEPWTRVVQNDLLESRRLVTNQAILDAVLSRKPRNVLDLGCGEGWLTRALTEQGLEVLGVDAIPELIEHARQQDGGTFKVMSFDAIVAGAIPAQFDSIVCNFSLLGEASVTALFKTLPTLLQPGGHLLVQTLHPLLTGGDAPYCDGWREETWQGIDGGFVASAPWYFRTLASWIDLHQSSGLQLREVREPLHPTRQQPASIVFISQSSA
ncbi:MAG: class I SAM-dependent methyltransferase [Candidatus Competibacteraceae bacterium]|nr:class I SAM-dependent methyltransferase [Candidatus Competibacteraceae bacterium]MCB1814279.1 class I SAM-dependent methyltransferase [Candidatus Competibacteraceae bacterium]